MPAPTPLPKLFIGSSSEGREVARNLQAELGNACEVVRWDQNVFEPSGYTLDSLISAATSVDFAVLVATPDDTTVSRGVEAPSARDNIVLEFGLFAGVLGRTRTFLLATGDFRLPTDVLGLTRLPYQKHSGVNERAAVTDAALSIERQMQINGTLVRASESDGVMSTRDALEREITLLCSNATSQGWLVKTNNATTLRLRGPRGQTLTLAKGRPETTRIQLRSFVAQLGALGLRVNSSIRRAVEESPL